MSSAVGVPSPRPSPAMRPHSPRYDSKTRFEGLPQTSFRRTNGNQSSAAAAQRRANAPSMRLPALPRFHPANFPSSHGGSAKATPEFDADASARTSPRSHQRGSNDSHKQRLAYYQHELLAGTSLRTSSPAGPHLMPTGSPGPVTPLELEADGGYLVAGARGSSHDASGRPVAAGELVDRLIRQESGQRAQQHRRSNDTQQSRER